MFCASKRLHQMPAIIPDTSFLLTPRKIKYLNVHQENKPVDIFTTLQLHKLNTQQTAITFQFNCMLRIPRIIYHFNQEKSRSLQHDRQFYRDFCE
ncbi:hypothetical protein SS50377_20522 [Spironucleus salmonicida]|uniref:Uncharacterized protein n=1 Tax=Spironucleus salmonicida TaxID=348837 RepID=A0A9P8LZD3_9EUKA|nr:hypothetical protein SS50377_20522 [Spironucleus salmonicida]